MKSYQSANGRGKLLLDHVFITVKDFDRAIAFYEAALKPLGIAHALDYDGKNGPERHPDLKASDGRPRIFWLRQGDADAKAAQIGLCRQERVQGERVLRGSNGGGRHSPANSAVWCPPPSLTSPLATGMLTRNLFFVLCCSLLCFLCIESALVC